MSVIVKIISAADGTITEHEGRYVRSWDPHVPFGTLAVDTTDSIEQAKHFPTPYDALEEWRTPSAIEYLRPDGEVNRPLTAVTILIERKFRH